MCRKIEVTLDHTSLTTTAGQLLRPPRQPAHRGATDGPLHGLLYATSHRRQRSGEIRGQVRSARPTTRASVDRGHAQGLRSASGRSGRRKERRKSGRTAQEYKRVPAEDEGLKAMHAASHRRPPKTVMASVRALRRRVHELGGTSREKDRPAYPTNRVRRRRRRPGRSSMSQPRALRSAARALSGRRAV